MNLFKTIFGRLSDEEIEKRYIKKNQPSGPKHVSGFKMRGTGYTRQVHEESNKRRKMARASRKKNRRH